MSQFTVAEPIQPALKAWRSIKIGTGIKDGYEFRKKLLAVRNSQIGNWADDMLNNPQFTVAPEEIQLDLVVVSVEELGFKEGASFAEICDAAKALGLKLCPAEVGPQLRLQYTDQPCNEWLMIGMEPIANVHGRHYLLSVERIGGTRFLGSHTSENGGPWHTHRRFVFLLPSDQPKVWKTIKLGTGWKDVEDCCKALGDNQIPVDITLRKIKFPVAPNLIEVNLVVVSVAELGFEDQAITRDVYEAAKQHELELCPAEVGPQLRLQYRDQIPGEFLVIGMEPLADPRGDLWLFGVKHQAGLWLFRFFGSPGRVWLPEERFVFMLPSR